MAARDVAAYAVAALDHPEAQRSTLTLGGPGPVSWRDITAAFARERGRDVPVRSVDPGQPVPGLPDIASGMLAAHDTYDSPIDMSRLARTYGVVPTTLAQFIRDFVASHAEAAATRS